MAKLRAAAFVLSIVLTAPSFGQPLSAGTPAPAWGTADTSYIQIPAAAFRPRFSAVEFQADSMGQTVWCPGTEGFCEFHASVPLPSGAQIVFLELDFWDTNPTASLGGYLVACTSLAGICTGYPSPFLDSGAAFDDGAARVTADVSSDQIFVDNSNHHYNLVTYMEGGGELRLAGWIIGYRLQVSPPPAMATFNDVPTGHPFFQFVEALAASGITAGCGAAPPLYCPDAPLTRGQMAVFLAKALGLHFP
jgi:hypothetical protein